VTVSPSIRLGALLAGGLLVALALAGCGGEASTLDPTGTERAVGRAVAAKVDPVVSETRCPDEIEREEGGTFRCTIVLKAVGELPVDVRQVDGQGSIDVTPAAAVVAKARIVSELTSSLRDQFDRSFTVRCSGKATEIRTSSSTSTCSARDETSKREVVVTVTDAAGSLAFEVQPPK
jgi:hypothetical protein